MTGRELIIYILEHGLEDKPVFEDGRMMGFEIVPEFAEENGVGIETVKTWIKLNMIPYIDFHGVILIPLSCKTPMLKEKENGRNK